MRPALPGAMRTPEHSGHGGEPRYWEPYLWRLAGAGGHSQAGPAESPSEGSPTAGKYQALILAASGPGTPAVAACSGAPSPPPNRPSLNRPTPVCCAYRGCEVGGPPHWLEEAQSGPPPSPPSLLKGGPPLRHRQRAASWGAWGWKRPPPRSGLGFATCKMGLGWVWSAC